MTETPTAAAILRELPPELRRLEGRPFGRDESGEVIAHGSGRLVAGAVRYLQDVAAARAERAMGPGVDIAELASIVERARAEVLDQLVELLNEASADERYRVTPDYLLNESNNYSYEFRLFLAEYARLLSGREDFFFELGRRGIPSSIVRLARPIGIRGTFAVLPRFTAKIVRTDLRVLSTSSRDAVIRWYGASQLAHMPQALHRRYIAYACAAYRGTMAAIPVALGAVAAATVTQHACQLDGADHCEWRFEWQEPAARRSPLAVLAGVGGSLAALAWLLLDLPGAEVLGVVGATLLPASLILYGGDARRRTRALREQQALLLEQRDQTEREYDRSEQANAELQQANLDLQTRIAVLTTLNEVSLATSTTLDLDEVLDRSLRAVVRHLPFDRALVLLADEEAGVLAAGRSVGGTDAMQALVRDISLPLDHPHSQLVALFHADGPRHFADVDADPHEPNRELAEALGVTAFLGTPLVSKGRRLGVLAVDNQLTGRPVDPADGPILAPVGSLVASAVDNARLYAQIEAQNRALEDRVERRTDQLRRAMAEAQEARAAAETASETKSAFLANVSHELRTPLTSVVGFAKLVRRRFDDVVLPAVVSDDPKVERAAGQIRQNLEIMAAEGERLTTMINDVLDLAKIEAGKLEWRREPLAIGDVIRRAAASTASLFEASGLRLDLEIADDLPQLTGDGNRLIQVVINLLSNAVKFTPSGGVRVRAVRDGELVTVLVRDTGVGIAAADHAAVFEQFRQAGDTLTDKPRGTGLGLPISRQIVEHHGGRMWLTSAPGEGSTFGFSLPIAGDDDEAPEAGDGMALAGAPERNGSEPAAAAADAAAGQARVLLVEDDPATQALVRQVLEPIVSVLEVAGTVRQGWARIRADRPNLVLLDVVLPDGDGLELARRVRADPELGSVRILLSTVIDDADAVARSGADGHLVKPFDAERLGAAVGELLDRAVVRG